MASFSLLDDETLGQLARSWVEEVISSRHLGGGLNNTSYLLDTDLGQLVMTVIDFPGAMPVRTHVSLLDHLRRQGIPVNEPLKTRNGRFIVTHGSKPVMMKRYLSGSSPQRLDDEHLVRLGALMGKVSMVRTPNSLGYESRRLPAGVMALIDSWEDQDHGAWVLEHDRLIVSLETADLPVGLVHGDLFADNAIIDDQDTLSIIDWETASIDILIIDLGFAIVGNCRGEGGIDARRLAALLEGYESVRPLLAAERKLLKVAIGYAATILGFWRYQYLRHLHQVEGKTEFYKEMVRLMADMEHNDI